MKSDVILINVIKFVTPFVLIFALYVQFHSKVSAGGGFQAGVIFACPFICYMYIYNLDMLKKILPYKLLLRLGALGVIIFSGVGFFNIIGGNNYLDYNQLLSNKIHGQILGIILIELGVGITVFSSMLIMLMLFSEKILNK
jgi:multicomponent Na+:H+ antiporter subunit B